MHSRFVTWTIIAYLIIVTHAATSAIITQRLIIFKLAGQWIRTMYRVDVWKHCCIFLATDTFISQFFACLYNLPVFLLQVTVREELWVRFIKRLSITLWCSVCIKLMLVVVHFTWLYLSWFFFTTDMVFLLYIIS